VSDPNYWEAGKFYGATSEIKSSKVGKDVQRLNNYKQLFPPNLADFLYRVSSHFWPCKSLPHLNRIF
jgi:hypothetical protein